MSGAKRCAGLPTLGYLPLLRAGEGKDVDGVRSGSEQRLAALAGRSAGGVNVVDKQDVPASNLSWPRHAKSAAEIEAALPGRELELTLRRTDAAQEGVVFAKIPCRVPSLHLSDGAAGQKRALVEGSLGAEEGDGEHEHLGGDFAVKGFEGCGEVVSQDVR